MEIQGRMEATIACLDMILRALEKFNTKENYISILCPTYQTQKLGIDRVAKDRNSKVTTSKETFGEYKLFKVEGN